MPPLDLRLYVVTDRAYAASRGVEQTVRLALQGGATVIQLRDKEAETRALVEEARALKRVCAERGVPLIINDRLDVALAAGADGVHVGQSDMPAAIARRLLGPDAIVGVSVRSVAEIRQAERDGATYVAANGVWSTATKTDFGAPLGLAGLGQMVPSTHLPLVAIGGIDASNAREVAATGCAGIAVVSAVMGAQDPAEACRGLRRAFESSQRSAGG